MAPGGGATLGTLLSLQRGPRGGGGSGPPGPPHVNAVAYATLWVEGRMGVYGGGVHMGMSGAAVTIMDLHTRNIQDSKKIL